VRDSGKVGERDARKEGVLGTVKKNKGKKERRK